MSDEEIKLPKLLIKREPDKYWDVQRTYSFSNLELSLFIVTGGRGIGKTTSCLLDVCNRWLKYGEEFVYLRRYKEETKKQYTMLDQIMTEVKTVGMGEGTFKWICNKKRMGYALTLTLQQTYKSGVDFSKVTTLIFDESILMPGGMLRYLPNEIDSFLELISTIFRHRKGYRIFILGNNLDLFNPYYEYFNIPKFDNIYIDKERGIYCEQCKDKEGLKAVEEQTPLYRLTRDTAYGDYHYGNKVLVTTKGNIGVKGKYNSLICRLLFNQHTLNIYVDDRLWMYVEHRDKVIRDDITYEIRNNTVLNYFQVKRLRGLGIWKFIEKHYYADKVAYNDAVAIQIMKEIMEEVSTKRV